MTQKNGMIWARLPLERAYNVRELGGLPVRGGGQTAWRAFLRADDISALTGADVAFLLDYGVKTVIDLRSKSERAAKPDRLDESCGVKNLHLPVMDDTELSPEALARFVTAPMGDMYVEMLGRRDAVRATFEAIAAAAPGCVLFHCAVGKDRTGVLAMLLLMLAGADRWDCVNNYCQTYQNLLRNEELFLRGVPPSSRRMFESNAEYVEAAYDYVQSAGGIEAYLRGCGVSDSVLEAVKKRLLGVK